MGIEWSPKREIESSDMSLRERDLRKRTAQLLNEYGIENVPYQLDADMPGWNPENDRMRVILSPEDFAGFARRIHPKFIGQRNFAVGEGGEPYGTLEAETSSDDILICSGSSGGTSLRSLLNELAELYDMKGTYHRLKV